MIRLKKLGWAQSCQKVSLKKWDSAVCHSKVSGCLHNGHSVGQGLALTCGCCHADVTALTEAVPRSSQRFSQVSSLFMASVWQIAEPNDSCPKPVLQMFRRILRYVNVILGARPMWVGGWQLLQGDSRPNPHRQQLPHFLLARGWPWPEHLLRSATPEQGNPMRQRALHFLPPKRLPPIGLNCGSYARNSIFNNIP